MIIRAATSDDADGVWAMLEPMLRAGETYALPRDMSRQDALAYWFAPTHAVFVAEDAGAGMVGTYFLRPNASGGAGHVANCGYVTATHASGRGIARAMCEHSIAAARRQGYRAMQFNFVVSTNVRAVRLWEHLGFRIVGRLPEAFLDPRAGYVDAFVMHRALTSG